LASTSHFNLDAEFDVLPWLYNHDLEIMLVPESPLVMFEEEEESKSDGDDDSDDGNNAGNESDDAGAGVGVNDFVQNVDDAEAQVEILNQPIPTPPTSPQNQPTPPQHISPPISPTKTHNPSQLLNQPLILNQTNNQPLIQNQTIDQPTFEITHTFTAVIQTVDPLPSTSPTHETIPTQSQTTIPNPFSNTHSRSPSPGAHFFCIYLDEAIKNINLRKQNEKLKKENYDLKTLLAQAQYKSQTL